MTAFVPRGVIAPLSEALRVLPVVVVSGMRQTGKTTFLQNQPELAGRSYRTLDDFAQLASARADPDAFVTSDEPLTIDEVQRCPELLVAIQRQVDRARKPGSYILSGSANLSVLKGVSESLAGRALYLKMFPMSRRELGSRPRSKEPFLRSFFDEQRLSERSASPKLREDEILRGGMPAVCFGEAEPAAVWFKGFEQTYLERDVRELARIGDLVSFRTLLQLAALRTAQLLNSSDLARDAKMNVTTANRYLGLMETSFVLERLPPFLANRASRLIKSSKLYLADSGLAAYLTGADTIDPGDGEAMRGPLFETYVAQNLASLLQDHWPQATMAFWNVQGRHEVDFVIEAGLSREHRRKGGPTRACIAIEVKAAARWTDRDLAGLEAFRAATPSCRAGILAYNGTDAVTLGPSLYAIPISLLLS